MNRCDMKNFINKDIKNIIKNSLQLNEALSSQQKQFNINTDFLSSANVDNHIELYEGYINNFNKSNAKLDSIDKDNVNSNHSDFRSVKLDETYNVDGVYLHELYFANIGDNASQIQMDSLSYIRLARD